jgi:two-component system chemotaxis sensor kinase CheA
MLDEHLAISPLPEADKAFVIVFDINGKEIGLPASELVDEKLVPFALDVATHQQKGVMGSLIIDQHTVMVLDIYELVELEEPKWLVRETRFDAGSAPRVLLVEDAEFYRRKIAGYLEAAGIRVLTAANGQEALAVLDRQAVDLVLTDIEMPVMGGYDLAHKIRARPNLSDLKILALSSQSGGEDIKQGAALGIDRHLVKLDQFKLTGAVMELCRTGQ